jgi:hypothetical protein
MSYFNGLNVIEYKLEVCFVWYAICFMKAANYELEIKKWLTSVLVEPVKEISEHHQVVKCK